MFRKKVVILPHTEAPFDMAVNRLTQVLKRADYVLICIGPDFASQMSLPSLKNTSLCFDEACPVRRLLNLSLSKDDPGLFYSFWGMMFNNSYKTEPSKELLEFYSFLESLDFDVQSGYSATVLPKILMQYEDIDGVFMSRYESSPNPVPIVTTRGNVRYWECGIPCFRNHWKLDGADTRTFTIPAEYPKDGVPFRTPDVPVRGTVEQFVDQGKMTSTQYTMVAETFGKKNMSGGSQVLSFPPQYTHPRCPRCGATCRPWVKMEGDTLFVPPSNMVLLKSFYSAMKKKMGSDGLNNGDRTKVAILEIGYKTQTSTQKMNDELMAMGLGRVILIRTGKYLGRSTDFDEKAKLEAEGRRIKFNPDDFFIPIPCKTPDLLVELTSTYKGKDAWTFWVEKKGRV